MFSNNTYLIILGEKPYKCRFCSWATISATSLKAHMKNHTNKHPFGCAQCHLGFKLKQDLIKHCQTAHSGVLMLQDGNSASENDITIPETEPNTVSQYLQKSAIFRETTLFCIKA